MDPHQSNIPGQRPLTAPEATVLDGPPPPSKRAGTWETIKGSIKESFGSLTGNHEMEAAGAAMRIHGQTEKRLAEERKMAGTGASSGHYQQGTPEPAPLGYSTAANVPPSSTAPYPATPGTSTTGSATGPDTSQFHKTTI